MLTVWLISSRMGSSSAVTSEEDSGRASALSIEAAEEGTDGSVDTADDGEVREQAHKSTAAKTVAQTMFFFMLISFQP